MKNVDICSLTNGGVFDKTFLKKNLFKKVDLHFKIFN